MGRSYPTQSTGTACGTDTEDSTLDASGPIDGLLPAAVSHSPGLEASSARPQEAAQERPMGLPPPDPGHPGHDLVARRQHPRAVRDGPRHRRHLPTQATPRRTDRTGVPEGTLPTPHEAPRRPGQGPARATD